MGWRWGIGGREVELRQRGWIEAEFQLGLSFWGFVPRAEYLNLFCWVRHPARQRAITISAANWASFNLYSPTQEEWDLREVIPHEPGCLTLTQLSGFLGSQGYGPSPAPVSAVLCSWQPMFAALAKLLLHVTLMFLSLLLILPSHKHQKSGFKQGALFLLQGSVAVFSISGQVIPTEEHICFLLR